VRTVPVPADFETAIARGTRSESGAPGPRYWQQRVRYEIEAELDPKSTTLRGAERIVYQNNSPDTLGTIVLHLYQNVFSEGVQRNRAVQITGGTTLERVAVGGQALAARAVNASGPGYSVQGTIGRVTLPRPLLPGDSTVLEIEWQQKVPPAGTFRTAWQDALGGRAFQVAQWYPQIAVYDDVHGWDASPYLGDGEFYLEYGDFDVAITVPAGWLVGATGELQNAAEVLTSEARRRLTAALASDSITHVVTEADLGANNATQPAEAGQLTWRFRAENVRDFAFATSDRYVWDATRARVPAAEPGGPARTVAVHALYRPGAPHWEKAARFGQHTLELFSRDLGPYLYPQLTIAEGSVGGMEYPQFVFIGKPEQERSLYGVIAHEVAHQWLPMMVGPAEAAYAWLDEGFASYYDALATADFYREAADPLAAERRGYLAVAGKREEVPMMRHTDLVSPYGARTVAAYRKPAVMLGALRTLLGDSSYTAALDTFMGEWLLKHPTPWDFFHTVERVSGRNLDWFFEPWYFTTGVLDQAISSVDTSTAGMVQVTVRDLGSNPMPAYVVATLADGQTVTATVPVETWLGGARSATVTLAAPSPVVRVEIDPEQRFPDVDRKNNVWTR
jgi:hypothetical protein